MKRIRLAAALLCLVSAAKGQTNKTIYIDGEKYPLTDAGFSAALAAAGDNGTILIRSGSTVLLTSGHSVTTSTSIRCEPGGGFKYPAATGAYIQFNQAGGMDGCTLNGQGDSTAQQAVLLLGEDEFFTDNTVTNFGSSGGNGILEVNGSGIYIHGNQMSNNSDFDIYVNAVTAKKVIHQITITDNQAGEIILHATASGSSIRHFEISNNTLRGGQNGKVEFCVEIGAFGADSLRPEFGAVTGNTCELVANGVDGGYSLSAASQITMVANHFDSDNHTYTIAPIELVVCQQCVAANNILNDGMGGDGISEDRCLECTVEGNQVIGFKTGASDYGIHNFVSNTVSPFGDDNINAHNLIVFPPGGAGIGIWQQCNRPAATCKNNIYEGNIVISDGTAGSRGLEFENDSGTSTGESLGANTLKSPATPYLFKRGVAFSKIVEQGTTQLLPRGRASITFSPVFDSAPVCTATDTSGAAPVRAAPSGGRSLTLSGTPGHVVAWRCSLQP